MARLPRKQPGRKLTSDRFTVGTACREARKELGLTLREMAEFSKLGRRTLMRAEKNGGQPNYRALLDAALRLNAAKLPWRDLGFRNEIAIGPL